jgi:hypothetical protein
MLTTKPNGLDDRGGTLSVSNLTDGASVVSSVSGSRFYADVPVVENTTNRSMFCASANRAGVMSKAISSISRTASLPSPTSRAR